MSSFLAQLYLGFRDFAEPVRRRLGTVEGFEYLCLRYGWDVALDKPLFDQIQAAIALEPALEQLFNVADELQAKLDAAPDADISTQDLGPVLDAAGGVIDAIAAFKQPAIAALAPPLDSDAFWVSIAEHLLDDLLEEYLRLYQPPLYLVLRCSAVIRYEDVTPSEPHRLPYARIVFDWDQISALLHDPTTALKNAYHWGGAGNQPFAYEQLVGSLSAVLRATHVATTRFSPAARAVMRNLPEQTGFHVQADVDGLRATFLDVFSPKAQVVYTAGAELFAATAGSDTNPSGIVLAPVLRGGATGELPLGRQLALRWKTGASADDVIGVAVFPDSVTAVHGDLMVGLSLEIARTTADPVLLFGTATSARMELYGPSLRLSFEGTVADPELQLRASAHGTGEHRGCRVVIPLDDADGFVQGAVRKSSIDFSFEPDVVWSSSTGLTFTGKPTLDVTLPMGISIGPVTLTEATISVRTDDEATSAWICRVGVGLRGKIGPIGFVVDRIGAALHVSRRTREELARRDRATRAPALGPIDVDLRFAPPAGIGVTVDAAGVVTGGGYLFFDPPQHTYAGALQLSLHESITVKAFGLISTRMPDGSKGYSLLVFITVEDFRPIPLGLGFTLHAIGGMLGVHRTFSEDALREGLQSDTLKSLLFPADPVTNAPAIIRSLATTFPAQQGSYLLGILARITWFTPTLIVFDLAVIFEFGQQRRLLVLGRISALLPSADNDLVRINLDAMGVLDIDRGTVSIDAVLVDSRLAHKYILTGAMAMRARWTDGPGAGFVLAVGGFNPRFAPPGNVPRLVRVSIALTSGNNPRITCEAYFAVTSNTLQFGARASVYAAAHGFSVEGDVGFDVLVVFRPFHFIADFHASAQLKHGSTNLFKVTLKGELQGPRPLHVHGKASFEICWCDISVGFDKTLIEGEKPPPPPGVDVVTELQAAFAAPENWSTRLPVNRQPGVALASTTVTGAVVVDPLGSLVVTEQLVPINTARDVDLFGGAPVAGARRFQVTATLGGHGENTRPIQRPFAPSQFFSMSDDEKLASPSFESMDAGVEFGGGTIAIDDGRPVNASLKYKSLVIDDPDQLAPDAPAEYPLPPRRLFEQLRTSSVATAALRTTGVARFREPDAPSAATIRAMSWAIRPVAEAATPAADMRLESWSEASAAVSTLRKAGGRWQIVPRHETVS